MIGRVSEGKERQVSEKEKERKTNRGARSTPIVVPTLLLLFFLTSQPRRGTPGTTAPSAAASASCACPRRRRIRPRLPALAAAASSFFEFSEFFAQSGEREKMREEANNDLVFSFHCSLFLSFLSSHSPAPRDALSRGASRPRRLRRLLLAF